MKICHLYPAVMLHDGPSNVLLALLRELVARGVENVVVGLKSAPEMRNPQKMIESAGGRYIDLAMSSSMLDFSVLPPLVRVLRQEKPDIVQSNLIRANLYGRLAARVAGRVPMIAVAHNVERYMVEGGAMNRATRFSERRTQTMTSAHVAVSEAVACVLAEVLGVNTDAIHVIANGLGPAQNQLPREEARAALGIPQDALVVGSVGRLHAQKNYPLLLRAIARALPRVRSLRLVLIGDGEAGRSLRVLATELGIADVVHWAGHRIDVERVISALDVFAMTSDYEGLPIALLEAMRAGIPCVVTRAGGMPEVVIHGKTGFVAECGDLGGVLGTLLMLACDAELRAEMGRAGEARFRSHYSAGRMAEEYLELYGRVRASISCRRECTASGSEN